MDTKNPTRGNPPNDEAHIRSNSNIMLRPRDVPCKSSESMACHFLGYSSRSSKDLKKKGTLNGLGTLSAGHTLRLFAGV